MVALNATLIVTAPQASTAKSRCECESGILDTGENGMNVLVYERCPGRLTVGFKDSDIVEQVTCLPDGNVTLWLLAGAEGCKGRPAADHDHVYEFWEPLKGLGRATAAPVRQLLTCPAGPMQRPAITVPDARKAILETRTGQTKYENLAREFVSQCSRPAA